jgi:2-oxoglutarate dehydrogenase E2 component (dihydrolipoamide succinyltransferase)
MATNIVVPELGESVVEARVARWLKKEGDTVAVGDALVELETDKIDLEVGAPQAGVLAKIERRDGEDVKIGERLGVIDEAGAKEARPEAPPAPSTDPPPPEASDQGSAERRRATPTARRVAGDHEVNLSEVSGSGPAGRVTRQDVERFLQTKDTGAAALARMSKAPPADRPQRREERVRMSKRRQTIAKRLVEAQRTAAMLTTFNEIDMSAVQDFRRRHKDAFKTRHSVGLGITSFFVKAAIAALKAFPRVNAEIDGEEMVLKYYYDIGVAVGASAGLVVPVLRDADRLSFADIETAIKAFAAKAEDGTLSLDDLRGGTFTITNGGVYGSLMSTPILNPPQAGILGLHKIEDRVVPRDGQVSIRPMMYVALTYDHRLVDGLEAVQFLVRVKEIIEDPVSLMLE